MKKILVIFYIRGCLTPIVKQPLFTFFRQPHTPWLVRKFLYFIGGYIHNGSEGNF